jgi:chromosome segregation ATPase
MTLWNIILVIVFNKIESLELNLANTASGLIRLTSDLRQAKTEFKTTSDELKKAAESVKDVKKDVEYVKSISSLNLFNNY